MNYHHLRSFAKFGEIARDVSATAVTLSDALVVVGGGVTGALKYILSTLMEDSYATNQLVVNFAVR